MSTRKSGVVLDNPDVVHDTLGMTTTKISGADPRFTIERFLSGHAYAANGNVHNPTPRYTWLLKVDGVLVDSDLRREPLITAARQRGGDYLNAVDSR